MSDEENPPQPKWEGPSDADGLPHGQGVMTYPPPPPAEEDEEEKPGDSYAGHMEHGKRQGHGKYTWSNGAVYEGEYADNMKQGQGFMTFPDKSKYEGSWAEDRMDGQGTYHYSSGDIYTGGFRQGRKHDSGMYNFKAHACQFLGIWSDGEFVEGKWVQRDGTTFKGSFEASIPSEGTFFFSGSGLVQQGQYTQSTGWQSTDALRVGTAAAVQ
ncbi:hypothetical protein OEZ85_002136 [Tetradesmus obliquus]|uniref:Uncharacterized protein n=1 Tax=Tetradesmus obliquus TaxID=3088 RepID=A0ABY8U309_TETOB|nr:hypothetical protein OEZ85_002136 [Tetradesmus obliquus]